MEEYVKAIRIKWTGAACRERSSAEFIQRINAKNAKVFAFILIIGFIIYHGMLNISYGVDSCKGLLSFGKYKGHKEWQPYGCMMHHYTQLDFERCLGYLAFLGERNHIVFVGDSRIEDKYLVFIKDFKRNRQDTPRDRQYTRRLADRIFVNKKLRLRVEFKWRPYCMEDMFYKLEKQEKPPSVIIAGCGTWTLLKTKKFVRLLQDYKVFLTHLVQPINALARKKSIVLWTLQEHVVKKRLNAHRKNINNPKLDLYNNAVKEILQHSAAKIWASASLVAEEHMNKSRDGLHQDNLTLKHDSQILFNMYCNEKMNISGGTCCSSAEPYTTLQVVTYSFLGVCLIIAMVMTVQKWLRQWRGTTAVRVTLQNNQLKKHTPEPDMYRLITALARMGIIMAYLYLCDRTTFFMKEKKYFSHVSFWLPFGCVFALGLFFTEDSRFTHVLHRDQTDELKGWMQLVILIYHMTGASSILPIYMHIRVLVSAYLFLSGYGHFCYFWQRGDASVVRLFQVLFRLNFMTVTLCLCMNRPYLFYYFVPLVSFWYIMVYLVFVLPPRVTLASSESNSLHYLYVVLKFVGLFGVITTIYKSEVFFENIFVTRPWNALTDKAIHEWWFRWKLDRYSTSYGMVFAFALLTVRHYNLLDDKNHRNLLKPVIALSATLVSFIGLGSYTNFSFLCGKKSECNEIHSYIVFVPIISYIVLRNIFGVLRTRYSSFFAWFGRISLELFISQYHIWLAADTHGVLILVPGYPVLNLMVTSFIFICAAHEVHHLTSAVMPYAIPSNRRLLLRNSFLFLVVLVLIGWNV